MAEDIAISVHNLTKTYTLYDSHADRVKETFHPLRKKYHRPFNALTNVSFDIKKGETLGIIGRNGSGKSTLLQIICGILQPTTGTAEVNGRISALLELGAGFNPDFTGRQNVYLSGAILSINREEMDELFDEIAAFADIGDFIDQPIKTYSSGMYVRLAFAVQACVKPDVLIVDEALSVGDIFFQQKCFAKMREIISGGTTCLFVSHDTAAVQNLCQRALFLNQGEISFFGDTTEAVSRYFAIMGSRSEHKFEVAKKAKASAEPVNNLMVREETLAHNILGDGVTKHGAGGLKILAARVTDSHGKDTSQVQMMEALSFYILIRADEDILEPNVGIDLFDRLGNLVFCTGSTQQNKPLPPMRKGEEVCVKFDITFTVQPGDYTYSLAVAEVSDDPNPNIGFVHERVEQLGTLTVNYDLIKLMPFYGIALLPTEIQFFPLY
jgi:ABC-type polysaccharide/polyol phosphate transport system ATPase subunit